jgi:hypothetical protein
MSTFTATYMTLRFTHQTRRIHIYGMHAFLWFVTIDESQLAHGDDEAAIFKSQTEAKRAAFAFVNSLAEDEGIL